MPASVPTTFYTTDLDVMIAFINDRSKFLDTVVDALIDEGRNANAAKMVAVLGEGSFFRFLPALLVDNAEVRPKVLLALGNLISSDNTAVAKEAFKIAEDNFLVIRDCLGDKATVRSAAYVIHSLAAYLAVNGRNFNKAFIIYTLVDTAMEWIARQQNIEVVDKDLLFVIWKFGDCTDVPTDRLLGLLDSSYKWVRRVALSMLTDQLSREDFDATYCDEVYDYLRSLMTDGKKRSEAKRHELAWAFSNLVTEDGMADVFFKDSQLVDTVIENMLSDYSNVAVENVMILANAVEKADMTTLTGNFLRRLHSVIVQFKREEVSQDTKVNTAVKEAIKTLSDTISAHAKAEQAVLQALKEPMPTPIHVPTLCIAQNPAVVSYVELENDAAWNNKTAPYAEFNLPCERDDHLPPTAYELLAKTFPRKPTSKVVYDLIRSVEANSNSYTPVPKDTRLTIDDLTTLEELGYSIVRGCVGISTSVLSRFTHN
jgi:hypothetical protein